MIENILKMLRGKMKPEDMKTFFVNFPNLTDQERQRIKKSNPALYESAFTSTIEKPLLKKFHMLTDAEQLSVRQKYPAVYNRGVESLLYKNFPTMTPVERERVRASNPKVYQQAMHQLNIKETEAKMQNLEWVDSIPSEISTTTVKNYLEHVASSDDKHQLKLHFNHFRHHFFELFDKYRGPNLMHHCMEHDITVVFRAGLTDSEILGYNLSTKDFLEAKRKNYSSQTVKNQFSEVIENHFYKQLVAEAMADKFEPHQFLKHLQKSYEMMQSFKTFAPEYLEEVYTHRARIEFQDDRYAYINMAQFIHMHGFSPEHPALMQKVEIFERKIMDEISFERVLYLINFDQRAVSIPLDYVREPNIFAAASLECYEKTKSIKLLDNCTDEMIALLPQSQSEDINIVIEKYKLQRQVSKAAAPAARFKL